MRVRRNIVVLLLISTFFASVCLGQGLPASFFGMHVNQKTTPWPSVTFGSYRMWDDGTAWTTVNPSNGVYNWAPIDAWVTKAQQNNTQLMYTFGRTPQWASSNPTLSCNYGPGQCAAPANMAYWTNFVTALVTRYKGKIKYYEMWNEPNQPAFWKGTTAQLVDMTNQAAAIIHSIDPNAQVGTPAATWTSTTAWAWLDSFLTAGGGSNIDVIDFHGYTGNTNAASILTIINNIETVRNNHGLSSLPLVISEGSWGTNSVISDYQSQAAFLVQRHLLIMGKPDVKAFFWYEWDASAGWGTLWDSTYGVHPAGVAYGTMTNLLIGATPNGCTQDSSATWYCSFTLASGAPALGVWNASTAVSYIPGAEYTAVVSINGTRSSITGTNPYPIGNAPVFFTGSTQPAAPEVSLAVTPQTATAPSTVTATATATLPAGVTVASSTISFGDGTTASGMTASHSYTQAGSYQVKVNVVDNWQRTTTATQTVSVTAPTTQATLSVNTASGNAPLPITASLTGSTSYATITSYAIDFGDGTVANTATASHTYNNPGTYTITGKITNSLGVTSSTTFAVTALRQPPVAKLSISQQGSTVTASTSGSTDATGTITSSVIAWGDGTSTQAVSGTHTYAAAGTYTVVGTVTDSANLSASASQAVTVTTNQPPVASMVLTQVAAVQYKVSTSNSYAPSGYLTSTVISWGDGHKTVGTSGSHVYSTAGTFTVTVTVTDNHGMTASTSGIAKTYFGIYLVSPTVSSTTNPKVHVVAYAAAPCKIVSAKILVDGQTVFTGTSWDIDAYVTMASGTHTVTLQAVDQHNTVYSKAFGISVN